MNNTSVLSEIELELRMIKEVVFVGWQNVGNMVKFHVLLSCGEPLYFKNLISSVCKRYLLTEPFEVSVETLEQQNKDEQPQRSFVKKPIIEPEKIEFQNNELMLRVSYLDKVIEQKQTISTVKDSLNTVINALKKLGFDMPFEFEQVELLTEVTHLASVIIQKDGVTTIGVARGVTPYEATALAAIYALNRIMINP
jgi:hypothetical protein